MYITGNLPKLIDKIERAYILDAPIDLIGMSEVIVEIEKILDQSKLGNTIFALNPRKVISLSNDQSLKEFFDNATVIIPDGIGVVWGVRLLLGKKIERVTGIDLMHNVCKLAARKGHKIFIFGATEAVNVKAVKKLRSMYPGICIVGRRHGYISSQKIPELIQQINDSGAEILFVALGSPKQEAFLRANLPELNIKICQGIGGTLDIISGKRKRAPIFLQKVGLEGFYRLLSNPTRYRNYKYQILYVIRLFRSMIV